MDGRAEWNGRTQATVEDYVYVPPSERERERETHTQSPSCVYTPSGRLKVVCSQNVVWPCAVCLHYFGCAPRSYVPKLKTHPQRQQHPHLQ